MKIISVVGDKLRGLYLIFLTFGPHYYCYLKSSRIVPSQTLNPSHLEWRYTLNTLRAEASYFDKI